MSYFCSIISAVSFVYAADGEYIKPQISDNTSISTRLDTLEKGMDILQKYVYNLHVSQNPSNGAQGRAVAQDSSSINVDEISDQFKGIRADIEKLQHEIGRTNDKLLQISADTERRLNDLETPAINNAEATKIAEKVEAQLIEINPHNTEQASKTTPKDPTAVRNAEDSFKNAYLLVKERKFSEAKAAFETFKQQYPKSNLLGAAHYWLGEIYMEESAYDKAAMEYLAGYQCGVVSGRAPDNLMRLGEVLMRLGKRQEACTTFAKLEKEFPNAPSAIRRRSSEMSKESACR